MAARMKAAYNFVTLFAQRLTVSSFGSSSGACCHSHLNSAHISVIQKRYNSFFNTFTSDQLWKSMTALTGKAHKKARGKRPQRRRKKDLNKGQIIGEGQAGIGWPGLNAPVIKNNVVQVIHKKEADPEREEMLRKVREDWDKRKKRVTAPEDMGWTSKSWGGRSLGPPDPIPGENFEGFDSKVLHVRRVFNMTGTVGRKRSISALVAVGNKKGAIGYAYGKAPDIMAALRKAKNKAANHLVYVETYNGDTLFHDVESTYMRTRIRMKAQNKGHGLRCHRVLIEICKLAGIKDLYARVYGSKNPVNMVPAFFNGLLNQETHQQIADRTKMHVVEFRKECGPLPIVVASPKEGAAQESMEKEWDKELPLEWKEERQRIKESPFAREGILTF
ncbi:28S ribosomal protein S5, mitochondrial-like [Anneissia japonica]|uniref:28S ribosomal protein S5, mitochondrial-like n=1 Tax=Anneissia japonica TaxID=1529436 RepID=UPI0014259C0B|nr:28S ribosomal protein S5, mitochondrial-like [Anneissia japonica]